MPPQRVVVEAPIARHVEAGLSLLTYSEKAVRPATSRLRTGATASPPRDLHHPVLPRALVAPKARTTWPGARSSGCFISFEPFDCFDSATLIPWAFFD